MCRLSCHFKFCNLVNNLESSIGRDYCFCRCVKIGLSVSCHQILLAGCSEIRHNCNGQVCTSYILRYTTIECYGSGNLGNDVFK